MPPSRAQKFILTRSWIKQKRSQKQKWKKKTNLALFVLSFVKKRVNANNLEIHALAYNIFNYFRRLVLPASMRKLRIDAIRLKLVKVAAKVASSARYLVFKLCSSCPYKGVFYETLHNIDGLKIQLEWDTWCTLTVKNSWENIHRIGLPFFRTNSILSDTYRIYVAVTMDIFVFFCCGE